MTHSPVIFFSRRMVSQTPPSLVKLSARLRSFTTGWLLSTPIIDQVPEERYA